MTDIHDLQRFVDAQADTYQRVQRELGRGQKTSHWMWFIFPQLIGLGSSDMARTYAIASLDEARAYLAHPLLGARLRECVTLLQDIPRADAEEVFGTVDARKLRSSLTLFQRADGGALFDGALARWFDGQVDERTDQLLVCDTASSGKKDGQHLSRRDVLTRHSLLRSTHCPKL